MTPGIVGGVFGNSVRIGAPFGIEVRIDVSWLVIAFLIGWSFAIQFGLQFPDMATSTTVVFGAASAVIFFGSVLLHELSHSVMARRLGIPVAGITLFLFGGVTETKAEAESAGDEFRIAVVGPLTSLGLAGLFWLVALLAGGLLGEPVTFGLERLAFINLLLAVFNMLPGMPLDGGRVLRSLLWKSTGSLIQATRTAARGGQLLAALLIGLGIYQLFIGNLGGLWFAAIGWFLLQAAISSGRQVVIRSLLKGVDAGDLMSPDPVTIPPRLTLQEAVDSYFLRYDHSAFPVEDEGVTTGLLTLRAVRQVDRDEWERRKVFSVMTQIEDVHTVPADLSMEAVLEQLQAEEIDRVLVMEGGRAIGILTPRDIARWVQRSEELGLVGDA